MLRKWICVALAMLLVSVMLPVHTSAAEEPAAQVQSSGSAFLKGPDTVSPGERIDLILCATGATLYGASFSVELGAGITLLDYTYLQNKWTIVANGSNFLVYGSAAAVGSELCSFTCEVSRDADRSADTFFTVRDLVGTNGYEDVPLGEVTWRGALEREGSIVVSGAVFAPEGLSVSLCTTAGEPLAADIALAEGQCIINGLTSASFCMTLAKEGYIPRTVTVTPDGGVFALPDTVQIVRAGNVNGATDGQKEVFLGDMQCLYTYLSTGENQGSISDFTYFCAVADVNGDGNVNILDYQTLYDIICSGVSQL